MPEKLTRAQLEIVVLLANGKRVSEIARTLNKSQSTINKTITRAQKRMGAATMPHLVSLSIVTNQILWSDDKKERALPDAD